MDAVAAALDIAAALRARRAVEQRAARAKRRLGDEARAAVPMSDEQIAAVAECLNRHGVAYVFVGGGAAQLHGAPITRTRDADVVPAREAANLDRLAAALREMNARLWVGPDEPDGLEMVFDRGTLAQIEGFLNLITTHGPLDITYRPDGTQGYADLARSAVVVRLLGVAVLPTLIEYARRRSDP